MIRRRPLALALAAFATLVLMLALALAWLLTTTSGLHAAVWVAQGLTGSSLQVEVVEGRLFGPLRIGRLVSAGSDRRIVVEDLVLDWQPGRLRERLFFVDRLHIGRLELQSRDDGQPREAPDELALPFAVEVGELRIGRLQLGDLPLVPAAPDEKKTGAVTEISDLLARLSSDGERHRLHALRLATSRLGIEASGELVGRAPFAVSARGRVAGEQFGQAFSVALDAGGTLRELALAARSESTAHDLHGEGLFDVFADQPLLRGELSATRIDPAAWLAGAPRARLAVQANATPDAERGVHGELTISNSDSGRLDAGKMPLRRLQAEFAFADERVLLSSFTATLSAGTVSGTADWTNGVLTVDAELARVDAAAWHRLLKPTRLSGPLKAELADGAQSLTSELRDPRFTLALEATRSAERLLIREARLLARGGSLEASGSIVRKVEFDLSGRLRNFDPAAFFDLPGGRLNATLSARGRFAPQLVADLQFVLADSTLAGRPATGRGDLVVHGERLQRAEITLRTGDNRLEARGRLGLPGDRLELSIEAPRLEQVGLGGALSGRATLAGGWRAPTADWQMRSPRLLIPGGSELRDLASHGRFEPTGPTRGELTIARLTRGGQPQGAPFSQLSQFSLAIDGQRGRHRIDASARLAGRHPLRLAASGGFDAERRWSGEIQTLDWRGPNAFALLAPARLEAAIDRLVLGRATLAGDGWQATSDELRWAPGRLQGSGRFGGLPAALVVAAAAPATSLRVGGEWRVDLGQSAAGQLRVYREAGDLVLAAGDETLALGIERLDGTLTLGGRQAQLLVQASGKQLGSVNADLVAALRVEDGQWTLARNAPWQGKARLELPSIAWLSALAGDAVRLDGRLQADLALGGTPTAPSPSGQISGSGLRVRLLDYGLDLGGGTLRVDLTAQTARLARLELISVPTQRPNGGRIDFARLTQAPGRLIAEGEIRTGALAGLNQASGRIALRAERLTVSQLPDRWLMVSGSGGARLADGRLALAGELTVDAAYVELPEAGQPTLSADVVVEGRGKAARATPGVGLDLRVDLGEHSYFAGAGLESRLAGAVDLTTDRRGELRANGTIRTVGGSFEAYGRELSIERGIVNFSGPLKEPSLNVRALRRNLPVEAGVEVSGRISEPKVRLVSEPEVPDAEKLSWMVLGRPPSQGLGAQDADLLLSAAMALRGNQGKGSLQSLVRGLGLDELSIGAAGADSRSRFPTSSVAGTFGQGSATVNEQIATVGKRIGANAVLSYERSLASAENVVRLTVDLTRSLALIGRIGSETTLGLFYTFAFGGPPPASRAR